MTKQYEADDLRRTFAMMEDNAPDGLGMIEAARTAAVGRKRRRRAIGAAGAALALVAGATTALAVTSGGGGGDVRPAATAATAPTTAPAAPLSLTVPVSFAPSSGLTMTNAMSNGLDAQTWWTMHLRSSGTGTTPTDVDLRLSPDGTEAKYRSEGGTPAKVHDAAAFVNVAGDSTPAAERPTTVVWQLPSGLWAVLIVRGGSATTNEARIADALRVAEALRADTPVDVPQPVRLPYVPAGLEVKYGDMASSTGNQIWLTDPALPLVDNGGHGAPQTHPLLLMVNVADKRPPSQPVDPRSTPPPAGTPVRIGTMDFLYWESDPQVPGGTWQHPARFEGTVGSCFVSVETLDRNRVTRADLEEVIRQAQFKDCKDQSTWVPPFK
ncbi:hypothetical protein [Yinghuangia seranimata]|uniref:hypothetical protein n=1 Tax=Yinghuangia seranimata TaxID=408067 RepID=UPI00248B5949|nr:hypothetical protein [Yinghuangia seranimata]MDI2131557.1 hypothetical protein [Yinghuangia seranimata]